MWPVSLRLLMQAMGPAPPISAVRQIMKATTVDLGTLGADLDFGFGRVDALAAIQSPPPLPPTADYEGDGRTDLAVWRPSTGDVVHHQFEHRGRASAAMGCAGRHTGSRGLRRRWQDGSRGLAPVHRDVVHHQFEHRGRAKCGNGVRRATYRFPGTTKAMAGRVSRSGARPSGRGTSSARAPGPCECSSGAHLATYPFPGTTRGMAGRISHSGARPPGRGTSSTRAPAVCECSNGARRATYPFPGTTKVMAGRISRSGARHRDVVHRQLEHRSRASAAMGRTGRHTRSRGLRGGWQDGSRIYRPSTGTWYIINSSTGALRVQQWGMGGDEPLPGWF